MQQQLSNLYKKVATFESGDSNKLNPNAWTQDDIIQYPILAATNKHTHWSRFNKNIEESN